MTCSGCPSSTEAFLAPAGSGPLAIVLDTASESEVKAGQWLAGKRSGGQSLLKQMLLNYVDDLEEVYITSAVKCRPNPTKKAMQKKALLSCADDLKAELEGAGIEKVICFGPMGYGALTGAKALPAVTRTRGRWIDVGPFNVLGSLPPGFAVAQQEYFRDLAFDVQKAFTTNGPQAPPDVDIWVVDDEDGLSEVWDFLVNFTVVSGDVETTGFSPHSHSMLAYGLGVLATSGEGTVIIFSEHLMDSVPAWKIIEWLTNDPEIEFVFHNAKFDLQHTKGNLERLGLTYDPANVHDTMMLHYALDERPMGKFKSHGLKTLSQQHFDAPDYDIEMGKWLKEWAGAHADLGDPELRDSTEVRIEAMRDDMHRYLAFDVYYTARLYPDLWNECMAEDECLLDIYEKVYMPATVALAQVEYHGMLLDRPMYERTRDLLDERAATIHGRIVEAVGIPDFNPGSSVQVKAHLYETLGMDTKVAAAAADADVSGLSHLAEGIRSRGTYTDPARLLTSPTAAPVLKMLVRGYPEHANLLNDIVEWRNLTKNAGTYIKGLLARCDVDGRVHGSFNIHGAASGRLSSSNPNLQNMPPASHTGVAVRSGFTAPEGWSLIDADYKQLEVRVAAELSHDPTMIQMFKDGGDPHAKTSETIYGKPNVSHYERMLGKIITFGLLYGRSPDSIATGPEAEDIVARGGKRWEPDDVREFFGNLLSEWNVYAKWRQDCREAPYRDGEITFSLGRKRRFHFIPRHDGGRVGRQGINTPCQGTASDFCLNALIRLHERLKDYPAQVVCTVHDSLLIEVRDDVLDEVTEIVREVMEKDSLWITEVPLAIDLKVSQRWSQDDDEEYGGDYVAQSIAAVVD